jgi:hypothetical protein
VLGDMPLKADLLLIRRDLSVALRNSLAHARGSELTWRNRRVWSNWKPMVCSTVCAKSW